MSDDAPTERLNMRLTGEDTRWLRLIAADIQRRRGSPFVQPAQAVRHALWVAAQKIAADGMAEAAR